MNKKIMGRFLFFFLGALLLTSPAGGTERGSSTDESVRAVVLYRGDADPDRMETALAALPDVSVLWRYDRLFCGAAVEAGTDGLEALEALDGVSGVSCVRDYEPASAAGKDAWPDGGLAMMGAEELWQEGWTGDGTVIAVLDSGLRVSHEAFADDSLVRSPALSREFVAAFASGGGTKGRYVSTRIPFAYDYYNRDDDVSTTNSHGTHVTALAAGYVGKEGGTAAFRGAAPGAQILSMKIFPDNSGGGTDDAVILRALEDALNLGADVINISAGTGAGFSRDGLLDGLYSQAYAQLAEAGVVVCCSAGNEGTSAAYKTWAPALPTGSYTDYGAVTSPASYRGAVAVAAAEQRNGRTAIAGYSAWGPATELHLAPALAGAGGPLVSAGTADDSAYFQDYGTSMASGSISGVFAVTLQALRERGITDKAEAARLAQGLLESTAQVLSSGSAPFSPRKQGAGLADLEAALDSALTIVNPLAELGDSREGRFLMAFTVKNFSDKAVTASVKPQVLTDAHVEQNGTYYSSMTARDITAETTVTGPTSVTVPAGGETEVKLELSVGDSLRQELEKVFPNGFYVEGYVTLSGGGQPVHGTFLGYCGDWEAAPVTQTWDFRDLQKVWYRLAGEEIRPTENSLMQDMNSCLAELGAELGANLAYLPARDSENAWSGRMLGSNGYAVVPYADGRAAIPGRNSGAVYSMERQLCVELYTLRPAAGAVILVTDPDTGEIYHAEANAWVGRSSPNIFIGRIDAGTSFLWNGTDAKGSALPGGARAQVAVYAWLEADGAIQKTFQKEVRQQDPESFRWLLDKAYDGYRVMSFPVTVDNAAPALVSAALEEETLRITLKDDQYLAYASVQDVDGLILAEQAYAPEKAGESAVLTVDLSAWRVSPDALYVTVEDYASNLAGYALDLDELAEGDGKGIRRSAQYLLKDVDNRDWYRDAVDDIVGKGLIDCDGEFYFRPQRSASRSVILSALYRANQRSGSKLTPADLPFTDLDERTDDLDALCWAYDLGLVSGRGDGTFGGADSISRQELAVMLYRCVKLSGKTAPAGDLSAFPDADSVADWAEDAMAWAVGQGLLRGGSDGKLSPRADVTRAETAQILQRFIAAI